MGGITAIRTDACKYADQELAAALKEALSIVAGPINFLGFPRELRDMVYENILTSPEAITFKRCGLPPILLTLNKQVHAEAFKIYYKKNTFILKNEEAVQRFQAQLAAHNNFEDVRHLHFSNFSELRVTPFRTMLEGRRRSADVGLISLCSKLESIKLGVHADDITTRYGCDHEYLLPCPRDRTIMEWEMDRLMGLTKLKTVRFHGMTTEYHSHFSLEDECKYEGLETMVQIFEWLKGEFESRNMEVDVDWSWR